MNLVSERALRTTWKPQSTLFGCTAAFNQAKGVLGQRARIRTNSQLNCSDEDEVMNAA
jgi:hypothetical protein